MPVDYHPVNIYIGYDNKHPVPAMVLWHSLVKNCNKSLKIYFLNINKLKFNRPIDPKQSTEFTYTRFLVPLLSNFSGKSLFIDSDMLCLSDITELLDTKTDQFWLACVKQNHIPKSNIKMGSILQEAYPRKNWSSLIIFNNCHFTKWTKEYVESASGATLHRFLDVPDEKIGEIAPEWNSLDLYNHDTKIIHYTSGGPWIQECDKTPESKIWWEQAEKMGFGDKQRLIDRWHNKALIFCEQKSIALN